MRAALSPSCRAAIRSIEQCGPRQHLTSAHRRFFTTGRVVRNESHVSQGPASSRTFLAFAGGSLVTIAALYATAQQPLQAEAAKDPAKTGTRRIRLAEIKKHGANSKEGIWVSRGTDVYGMSLSCLTSTGPDLCMSQTSLTGSRTTRVAVSL